VSSWQSMHASLACSDARTAASVTDADSLAWHVEQSDVGLQAGTLAVDVAAVLVVSPVPLQKLMLGCHTLQARTHRVVQLCLVGLTRAFSSHESRLNLIACSLTLVLVSA